MTSKQRLGLVVMLLLIFAFLQVILGLRIFGIFLSGLIFGIGVLLFLKGTQNGK